MSHQRNTRSIAHAYIVKTFQLRMRTLAQSSEHNARSKACVCDAGLTVGLHAQSIIPTRAPLRRLTRYFLTW